MSIDRLEPPVRRAGSDEDDGDRRWPWPARLATTLLLVPVWCGVLVCVEGDLSSYGLWITFLSVSLFVVIGATVWATTGRSQR
jgi:hypothetical protein